MRPILLFSDLLPLLGPHPSGARPFGSEGGVARALRLPPAHAEACMPAGLACQGSCMGLRSRFIQSNLPLRNVFRAFVRSATARDSLRCIPYECRHDPLQSTSCIECVSTLLLLLRRAEGGRCRKKCPPTFEIKMLSLTQLSLSYAGPLGALATARAATPMMQVL